MNNESGLSVPQTRDTLIIYSGGLDSTTLLYEEQARVALAVTFGYARKQFLQLVGPGHVLLVHAVHHANGFHVVKTDGCHLVQNNHSNYLYEYSNVLVLSSLPFGL